MTSQPFHRGKAILAVVFPPFFPPSFFGRFFVLFLLVLQLLLTPSCKSQQAPSPAEIRDTTINKANAYSDLFFDSSHLATYIQRQPWHDSLKAALSSFYHSRNYEYAWLTGSGITEQAFEFGNMLNEYIANAGDSAAYNPVVIKILDSAKQQQAPLLLNDTTRFIFEVNTSASFLRYARRAYQGNVPLSQKDLNWFIPRKRINVVALLDSFLKNPKSPAAEPVNQQYDRLRSYLLRYHQLKNKDSFPDIPAPAKAYRIGDTASGIAALKKRLHAMGDYTGTDTSPIFSEDLQLAVKNFQLRYGLKEDGAVGGQTLKRLNEPIDNRIQQILVNMERMRWVPAQPSGDFILVNIPQYRLIVYKDGRPVHSMKIVVGTSQHKTVIFTGKLKYVVFSPYWNVPPGILKNEVLPAIRRNPGYLQRNHMEWANGGVRQLPGPWNALGEVKFLFPNEYNIYLHDTPSKSLFGEEKRSFSHGCIRIEEPQWMAEWVLRNDAEWSKERIEKAMNAGKEQTVVVKDPIHVFIAYFTAWVDDQGRLNFRDDVYGHDKKLAERLFASN